MDTEPQSGHCGQAAFLPNNDDAPSFPGVYPSALSLVYPPDHDGDYRAYRNAAGGSTPIKGNTGTPVLLPSYAQVRKEVQRLRLEPELVAMREGDKSVPCERESASSFALSIPAPALLTQVDEHTMDLYVVTPSGETVASRVHVAVLICLACLQPQVLVL